MAKEGWNDMKKKLEANDGLAILRARYFANDPGFEQALDAELEECRVARQIHDLRVEAGLTQEQLAKRVGTSRSAIARLEDADYEGHSMAMLRRVAAALGKRVGVTFVPSETRTGSAA